MTKKYICYGCGEPCIIKVEKEAYKPFKCPYNETKYPEWVLMEDKQEFIFRGLTIDGVWVCGNLNTLQKKFLNIEAGTYISNDSGAPFAFRVLPETVVLETEV